FFVLYIFFVHSYRYYRYLHSFPTRRSSDLVCDLPKRVYGGLLHKMWYLESNGSQFALKQLNSRIQLTKEVKLQYELTEEIAFQRSEEHTSELQSRRDLVCRLLLEKKKIE